MGDGALNVVKGGACSNDGGNSREDTGLDRVDGVKDNEEPGSWGDSYGWSGKDT